MDKMCYRCLLGYIYIYEFAIDRPSSRYVNLVGALKDVFFEPARKLPERMSWLGSRSKTVRFWSQIRQSQVETELCRRVWSNQGSVDGHKKGFQV